MSAEDAASNEPAEAWHSAYSRDPNSSNAWDHSIKAVEHVLKLTVSPNHDTATLRSMLNQLRQQGHLWRFVLPGKEEDHSVTRLVGVLELMWPNTGRHGGDHHRAVTLEEAHAVVHLAVAVVQWGRAGAVVDATTPHPA